jgi:HNH endonuclease/AP2 domain
MSDIDPAILSELLAYCPTTGVLVWKARPVSMFKDGRQSAAHNCAIWNGKFADRPALGAIDKRGYRHGHLLNTKVKAHRVIWALVHGVWPKGEIDHINGRKSDNCMENLRLVSHAINSKNMRLKSNNTSGANGVRQRPSGRWAALMEVNGKPITIGTFETKAEAIIARRTAQVEHGFHSNHGTER